MIVTYHKTMWCCKYSTKEWNYGRLLGLLPRHLKIEGSLNDPAIKAIYLAYANFIWGNSFSWAIYCQIKELLLRNKRFRLWKMLENQKMLQKLRYFLGLVNFNVKFIPNLAMISEPLWRPSKRSGIKSIQKQWQTQILAYFDRSAKHKL